MKGDKATEEIEKGFSAVEIGAGRSPAPFFRFPFLKDPRTSSPTSARATSPSSRTTSTASTSRCASPKTSLNRCMAKLEKKGKGIILMHDFQQATAKAMPELLNELKAKGYKVVHMKAKTPVTTLAQWDEAVKSEVKGAAVGPDRPTSSVVRTIDEAAPAAIAKPAVSPASPSK